jgi:hypothetical protein
VGTRHRGLIDDQHIAGTEVELRFGTERSSRLGTKSQESSNAAASVPPCGTREPNIDRKDGDFIANGVNIRTGPKNEPAV